MPSGSRSSCTMVKWLACGDRDQVAGQMGGGADGVQFLAVGDQWRQFGGAEGEGQRLVDRRQAHRREGRDFRLGQPQLLVQVGVAQRAKFEDAGDGEARL